MVAFGPIVASSEFLPDDIEGTLPSSASTNKARPYT